MRKKNNLYINTAKKPVDSILGILFYRKISIKISRFLIKTSITPNQITIMSFLIILLAAILFLTGLYLYLIIGAILLHFSLIFDCVDGEIARMKALESKVGVLLDEALDNIGYFLIFLCLAYGVYQQLELIWIWLLAIFIISGYLMKTIIRMMIKNLSLGNTQWKMVEKKIGRGQYTLGWGGGFDEFLITFGAIFNQFLIVFIIICIGVNAHWIGQLILNLHKLYKSDILNRNKSHYTHKNIEQHVEKKDSNIEKDIT